LYNTRKKLYGELALAGDKSISHRLLMVGSLINDSSKIYNLSNCSDVLTTIKCLQKCNVEIKISDNGNIKIHGGNLKSPLEKLDCKNSGTTARLLVGLLAGQGLAADFTGDQSLLKRPMKRIIEPLKKMGLKINSNNNCLPIHIEESILNRINYKIATKSAQVKSAILFAALGCDQYSTIAHSLETRDHTEKLLKYLNFDINIIDQIYIKKSIKNKGFSLTVPGDISSACFLIAGAVLVPGSKIKITNVLYNKTRLKFIYLLKKMNANVSIEDISSSNFENTCTILASYSPNLKSTEVDSKCVIGAIDEIPILSIIATQCTGKTVFNGLEELKYKESDRAMMIYKNLKNMGADISYSGDRIVINGNKKLYYTTIMHQNDHRIAISFEILNLFLNNNVSEEYNDVVSISFPDFYHTIKSLTK